MNDGNNSAAETKKMVLDALSAETEAEQSIGKPTSPVLPLFGSMNVPISREEENECE